MEVLFSIKISDVDFAPDLFVNDLFVVDLFVCFFEIGLWCMDVCMCVCVCGCKMNIQRFISPKFLKIETPDFIHCTILVHR